MLAPGDCCHGRTGRPVARAAATAAATRSAAGEGTGATRQRRPRDQDVAVDGRCERVAGGSRRFGAGFFT